MPAVAQEVSSLDSTVSLALAENVSDVEKAFVSMPDNYYMTLTQDMRIIMLNRMRNGEDPVVMNKFRGESRIDTLDQKNGWIKIKNSESGYVEIKMLNDQNGKVSNIFLIATACGPNCSSHAGVFTLDWRLLPQSVVPSITVNDFLDMDKMRQDGTTDRVKAIMGLHLLQLTFEGEDHNVMRAIFNSEKELDEESMKIVKPYIVTNSIDYTWNGRAFVRKNKQRRQ